MTQGSIVKVFKALSDKNRFQILEYLKSRESCACDIGSDLSIAQSTLAHHMKILCDAGLVIPRKDGRWMYYCISDDAMQQAAQAILSLTEK